MIEDLIELAFAREIVRTVVADCDGRDEYLLERAGDPDPDGSPIRVRVRPDGKFSRAVSTEGLLTLGQVMTLCGLGRAERSRATVSHSEPERLRQSPRAARGH